MLSSFWSASSSPSSNTAVANADYAVANFGSTKFASDLDLGAISTSAYNDWTLNSDGIDAVDKSAITKFAIRFSGDFDNSEPSKNTASSSMTCNFADNGSNEPKLTITWTAAADDVAGFFNV